MLTSRSARSRALLCVFAAACGPAIASANEAGTEGAGEDAPEEATAKRAAAERTWLTGLGIGLVAGSSFLERAIGRAYTESPTIGPTLHGEIVRVDSHRLILAAGYRHLFDGRLKGSEQIRVRTRYQRVDLGVGYGFQWELLAVGARLGWAATIARVRTEMGDPTWQVEGDQVVYEPPDDPESSDHAGVTHGFFAGLHIGIALGRHLFGVDDLVEIRAGADYVRRQERDDFTVVGGLVFWPTRLLP